MVKSSWLIHSNHLSRLRSGTITYPDASLLLDDERGDHAKHAVLALSVVEDVAVEGPDSRLGRLDDGLEALTGRDVERVAHIRLRHQIAVLREDRHRHPMQVHGVDHQAFVHVANEEFLALLRYQWLGRREALAVETEAAYGTVVEHKRVVAVIGGPRRRVLRLDDEGAEQPLRHLERGVVVRVVHM